MTEELKEYLEAAKTSNTLAVEVLAHKEKGKQLEVKTCEAYLNLTKAEKTYLKSILEANNATK